MGCASSQPAQSPKSKPREKQSVARPQSVEEPSPRQDIEDSNEGENAQKILKHEQQLLRNKALTGFLERRDSTTGLDSLGGIDTSDTTTDATNDHKAIILKTRLHQRRKNAKINANKNQKWMIFSSSETFDDSEMTSLSTFMETAVKQVPELRKSEIPTSSKSFGDLTLSSINIITEDDPNSSIAKSKDVIAANRDNSVEQLVRLDRIAAEDTLDDQKATQEAKIERSYGENEEEVEFDLPPGKVDAETAFSVFELMKNGSKLSLRAMQKLLRHTFRVLKAAPTVNYINISSKEKLTVVGDIHGQLPDLIHIILDSGFPSSNHKFLFNGDFVDRGEQGVEVMCVLMALILAFPNSVFFNRGNHEDFAICSAYGFQQECISKYDDVTFGMFIEVFNYLPMYAIVNDTVLILHGGLFHALDVTIDDFKNIQRHEYSLLDMPQGGEDIDAIPRSNTVDFYKQLQRDTLWSDPKDSLGNDMNSRGAGVAFGPDVTKQFLDRNKLKMIIRSHECVRSGFDRPYLDWPEYENLLCTLFSASNYSNSGNTAAYLEIVTDDHQNVRNIPSSMLYKVSESTLNYTVHFYHVGGEVDMDDGGYGNEDEEDAQMDEDDNTVVDMEVLASKSSAANNTEGGQFIVDSEVAAAEVSSPLNSPMTIPQQIYKRKTVLGDAFHAADIDKDGIIPLSMWSDVMQHVLKLNIKWTALLPSLIGLTQPGVLTNLDVLPEPDKDGLVNGVSICITTDCDGNQAVNYYQFLNSFTPTTKNFDSNVAVSLNTDIMEGLYSNHVELEKVFRFFDEDGNGVITYKEFIEQCEVLNQSLPLDQRLTETLLSTVYQVMDVTESQEVDINLFFEMFRLADSFSGLSGKIASFRSTRKPRVASLRRVRSLSAQFKDNGVYDSPFTTPLSPLNLNSLKDHSLASMEGSPDSKSKISERPRLVKSLSLSTGTKDIFVGSDESLLASSLSPLSPRSSDVVDIKGHRISIDSSPPAPKRSSIPFYGIDI